VRGKGANGEKIGLHMDDYVAIAAASKTLEKISTVDEPLYGSFAGSTDLQLGGGVTKDFLALTGLQPVRGRAFTADEYDADARGPASVTMITWALWQEHFGGADSAVGSQLVLGGPLAVSAKIVGVLPRDFFFPETINQAPSFIVPSRVDARYLGNRNAYPSIIASVRPGYSFAQSEAEVGPILASVEKTVPGFGAGRTARFVSLRDSLFAQMQTPLLLLFIATACLLLLAWVNLAHLAAARATARGRELAIRAALGASRWRMARLMFAEAGVLSILGAIAGLAMGNAMFVAGLARTPKFAHVYRLLPVGLDTRVVAFTLALAALGMFALALWPAWRATRADVRSTLARTPGRARARWGVGGEALAIAGQAAFAVALVVTCALVVRTFVSMVTEDRGYDPAHVLLAGVQPPQTAKDEAPAVLAGRYRALVDELNRVPGIAAAATGNGVPGLTLPEGLVDDAGKRVQNVIAYQASSKMPATMGMRLEQGRLLTDDEAFSGAAVTVVDRTAADILWPGQSALGQTVHTSSARSLQVVGVLERVRVFFGADADPEGTVFITLDTNAANVVSRLMVAMRYDAARPPAPAQLAATVTHAMPGATWTGSAGMSSWERFVGQPRFLASSLGVLATLTVLLAGFGMLGVVSHLVSRRTREIGIRVALGADRGRVWRLVVRQAMLPAGIGVAIGLVLAFWSSTTVRAVISGVGPHDPLSFVLAAALTLVVGFFACVRPAMRASRIDPAITLRAE
jgi:predicted permease